MSRDTMKTEMIKYIQANPGLSKTAIAKHFQLNPGRARWLFLQLEHEGKITLNRDDRGYCRIEAVAA